MALFDAVRIEREAHPNVTLTHTGARILSELVALAEPVHWEVVAREVWPDTDEVQLLRGPWDVSLRRLRRRLAVHGIRADLIGTEAGQVWLVRGLGDVVEDLT
jgi:DNA-binding response OmpR family regulator